MSNSDLAHKIFNALFDDEDLNEMHNIGFIAQPLGYQISSVATIELELDDNHDRMVEEIAELKEALKNSQQVMNTFGLIHGNGKFSKNEKCQRAGKLIENHMDDIFIANKNLLAKLSQEGEEQ